MLGVFVAVIIATVQMFNVVPKGFIPDQDNDSLFVNLRAAQGHVVLRHGEVGAADRRHRHQESVRRFIHGGRRQPEWRRRRRRRLGEQRPAPDPADAASQPAALRLPDCAAAAAAAAALPRLPRVRQCAGGDSDRRAPGQPELQHHAAEPEHRRALRVGAQARAGDRRAGAGSHRTPRPISR